MAKQTINQGTAPTGAGGDTFRTGSAKLQANDDEIYAQLGANAQGVLPVALPITKGGTGATTAAGAITALGLENVFQTKSDALFTRYREAQFSTHVLNTTKVYRVEFPTSQKSLKINIRVDSGYNSSLVFGGIELEIAFMANATLGGAHYEEIVKAISAQPRTKGVFYIEPKVYYDSVKGVYYINIHKFVAASNLLYVHVKFEGLTGPIPSNYPINFVDVTASTTLITNQTNEVITPLNEGGTGATTAAQARTNLGLGTVATLNTGKAIQNIPRVRDSFFSSYGIEVDKYLGSGVAYGEPYNNINNFPVGERCLVFSPNVTNAPFSSALMYVETKATYTNESGKHQIVFAYNNNPTVYKRFAATDNVYGTWRYDLTSANTTVDANGFIKAASPIVELYADRIVLNGEAQQQEITFEKLGVGDYLIKGSSGFAQEGWYVEQPKDANGNIYHAVVYEQLENGNISVKTYEKSITETGLIAADPNKPIDIKENRFISIRLQELPTEEIEPEVDQTILDDEGQPAPSHYHILENGVWVISGEDAERLEQEQLAKMQPLTRRQFRLALAMNGYDLSQVEALIDQIPDPMQRQIALIEWQDATTFERLNTSLLAMANLMGLSAEQVNMLWNQALTL